MKHLFSPRLTALTLALILVLLLPGCNNPAPGQTEKVSVESPPVAEQPKNDETLTPTSKEEVKKEDKKDEKPVEVKTTGDDKGEIQSKIYEDPETGWMVYESLEGRFRFKYPKDFELSTKTEIFKKDQAKSTQIASVTKDYSSVEEKLEPYGPIFSISIYEFSELKPSVDEYFKKETELKSHDDMFCGREEVTVIQKVINNRQAIIQKITCPKPMEGSSGVTKQIFIKEDDKIWFIHSYIHDRYQKEWEPIFDKVIASFTLL